MNYEPLNGSLWPERIRIAATCRDADCLPKAPNAGEIVIKDGVECQVMHPGVLVIKDCYCGSDETLLIRILRGVHEPQEEKCFHEVLKYLPKNPIMIELGSYWAFYSLWLKSVYPDSTCHCIEVDTKLLNIGIKNFEINGFTAIFTNACLGRPDLSPWHTETVGSYIRALPSGAIFFERPWPTEGLHLNIPIIKLHEYIENNQIEYVDILHMDIQGQELDVLNESYEILLSKRVKFIFVSTHVNDQLHNECKKIITNAGYNIIAEHSIADSFSGDGLIVAKSPNVDGPEFISLQKRTDCKI